MFFVLELISPSNTHRPFLHHFTTVWMEFILSLEDFKLGENRTNTVSGNSRFIALGTGAIGNSLLWGEVPLLYLENSLALAGILVEDENMNKSLINHCCSLSQYKTMQKRP